MNYIIRLSFELKINVYNNKYYKYYKILKLIL